MLRAACLIRPLLAAKPVSSTWSSSVLRMTANHLKVQPPSLAWTAAGVRRMMDEPKEHRTASPGVEAALRTRDKLPPEYSIIYRAPLQYYIAVTYFSTWISILGVPFILGSIYCWKGEHSFPLEFGGVPLFSTTSEAYILTGMLVLVIANVAHTVSKYPYRIYRNPKEHKYVAVFQHFFPGMVSKKEFVAGDVKKVGGLLWNDSCYAIKKKKMLLVPEHFSTPIELDLMQIDPKLNDPVEIRKRRSKMV